MTEPIANTESAETDVRPDPEIEAAAALVRALDDLPEPTQARLLRWACDRYGVKP